MELKGKLLIPLGQVTVWNGLNDPEVLRASLPGCESIEKTAEDGYKLVMVASVGPVKARFSGSLTLSNVLAPHTYTLTFEGSGGAVGFGKGSADVELSKFQPMNLSRQLAHHAGSFGFAPEFNEHS